MLEEEKPPTPQPEPDPPPPPPLPPPTIQWSEDIITLNDKPEIVKSKDEK